MGLSRILVAIHTVFNRLVKKDPIHCFQDIGKTDSFMVIRSVKFSVGLEGEDDCQVVSTVTTSDNCG